MNAADQLEKRIVQVAAWAARRADVRAVLLVGSYAQGGAGVDSDVDIVLIADDPAGLVSNARWTAEFGRVRETRCEDWGRVTSVRVFYADGLEVEFGVTDIEWLLTPLDAGTAAVLRAGCRVLWDPGGLTVEALRSLGKPGTLDDAAASEGARL